MNSVGQINPGDLGSDENSPPAAMASDLNAVKNSDQLNLGFLQDQLTEALIELRDNKEKIRFLEMEKSQMEIAKTNDSVDDSNHVDNSKRVDISNRFEHSIPQSSFCYQFSGGNPLQMIPTFSWDPLDRNEVERFIFKIKEVGRDHQWPDTYTRHVLESKLAPKVRSIYFNGLGCDNELSLEARLDEFTKLFTRKLAPDERQDQFYTCHQLKDESVISYKLRLIAMALDLKKLLIDSPSTYQVMLSRQFLKGLKSNVRFEVEKSGLSHFDHLVDKAIEMERLIEKCGQKGGGANAIAERDDKIAKLGNEIERLNLRIDGLTRSQPIANNMGRNNNRDSRTQTFFCNHCRTSGHSDRFCRSIPVDRRCGRCNSNNHTVQHCHARENTLEIPSNRPLNL